jgi:hypothetical protein
MEKLIEEETCLKLIFEECEKVKEKITCPTEVQMTLKVLPPSIVEKVKLSIAP